MFEVTPLGQIVGGRLSYCLVSINVATSNMYFHLLRKRTKRKAMATCICIEFIRVVFVLVFTAYPSNSVRIWFNSM